MSVDESRVKVIDSVHTSDGTHCVDVVQSTDGFSLQTCRRDEDRWQVIARPGVFQARVDAVASARAIVATLESVR